MKLGELVAAGFTPSEARTLMNANNRAQARRMAAKRRFDKARSDLMVLHRRVGAVHVVRKACSWDDPDFATAHKRFHQNQQRRCGRCDELRCRCVDWRSGA